MNLNSYEERIGHLYGRFKSLSNRLGSEFVGGLEFNSLRIGDSTRKALLLLADVESRSRSWSSRELPAIYRKEQKEVGSILRSAGRSRRSDQVDNDGAIRLLVSGPKFGLIPKLTFGTSTIRANLRLIQKQLSGLKRSSDLMESMLSRLRTIEPGGAQAAIAALANDISEALVVSTQVFRPRASGLPGDHVFANLSNIAHVKIGGRMLRVESYALSAIRWAVSKTVSVARRNRLLESGEGLIQIKPIRSQRPTPCHLYIGRVFALTSKAAEEFDVPHVLELPEGGVPFHPGCSHEEIPWIHVGSRSRRRAPFTRPPDWALNTSYESARMRFFSVGGDGFAEEQNPFFLKSPVRMSEDAGRMDNDKRSSQAG